MLTSEQVEWCCQNLPKEENSMSADEWVEFFGRLGKECPEKENSGADKRTD